MDILNRSEDSVPFRAPVNFELVPDYLRVVDYPMDLQTVGEQLQDGCYATPSKFAKDVHLIFVNSKKFNPNRKSRIYAMTDRLLILFEDHIRLILATYATQKTASGCKSKLFYFNLSLVNLTILLSKAKTRKEVAVKLNYEQTKPLVIVSYLCNLPFNQKCTCNCLVLNFLVTFLRLVWFCKSIHRSYTTSYFLFFIRSFSICLFILQTF